MLCGCMLEIIKNYVVYQSQLFLLLHHDAMLLHMHYVINTICTCI